METVNMYLHLELTEVVLMHCNIVNNDHQQSSRVLYTLVPNKLFGQLLDISPKNFIFYQLQILLVLLELIIIMEDITKFFRSSSKKRDLSDTSKTDEDPKKYEKQALQVLQMKVMFLMKVLIRRVVERFYLIV